jgi:signal peptidase II
MDYPRHTTKAAPPVRALGLVLAALIVIADQATKAWVTAVLQHDPAGGPRLLGGKLVLTYSTNTGGAFGILPDRGPFFIVIGLAVLGGIALVWSRVADRHPALWVSLGLLVGGAMGNLIDRTRLGYVVDFVQISIWPVFNLADTAIVCGVVVLMYRVGVTPGSPGAAAHTGPGRSEDGT